MSSLKQFELFHGIVLAKLVRNENPVTLRMIENSPKSDDWRIYRVTSNSIESAIFVKHRITYEPPKKPGKYSWQFAFNRDEVCRIIKSDTPIYVALVCGRRNVQEYRVMEICFLNPDYVVKIFPEDVDKFFADKKYFSFSVRVVKNNELKVSKLTKPIKRTAIEDWGISDN